MSSIVPGRSTRIAVLVSALLAIICAAAPLTLLRAASAAPQAGPNSVYLPLIIGGRSTTPPPTTPTPVPPTPPAGADGAFFFEPTTRTAASSVVVDAQGRTHVAYYYYVSANEGADVVYSYCPAPATGCVSEGGWRHVRLFGPVSEVQLAVTADGHPRLLAGNVEVGSYGGLFTAYTYAECNQSCLDAANWQSVKVDSVRGGYIAEPRETPRRSFALNALGQPAFVASDNGSNVNGESRYGTFLYSCTANCVDAASWTATRVTPQQPDSNYSGSVDNAVLKFTSANQPRILGEYYPAFSEPGYATQITYFACDSNCHQSESWASAAVSPRGNGPRPAWDLDLDAQDHPRAVVYHEDTGDDRAHRLFYFTCNADCTSAAAWTPVNLSLPVNVGLGADVELNAAGNPRIAHLASNGVLVYSFCESGCTDQASWLHGVAEKPEALDASGAAIIPTSCVSGIWDNYGVNLALDPQGNPRISYDATYQAQCPNLPPPPGVPPSGSFQEVAHLIRMYFTPQP